MAKVRETSNVFQTMINSTPASFVVANFRNKDGREVKVKNELHFIDSFKFMASSLDKLVSNLSLEKLKEAEKVFKDKIELILRKGVYPYNYTSSIEKFNEIGLNC